MRILFSFLGIILATMPSVIAGPATEIPLEYRDGLLWLKATATGSNRPMQVLMDSGAAVSVLDCRVACELGLKFGESVKVRGVGSETMGCWTAPVSIRLRDVQIRQRFLAMDLQKLSAACGQHVDGLIGSDFFNGKIVQIDYQKQTVRLLPAVNAAADAQILPLRTYRGAMRLPVGVNGGKSQWMRLDTGCAKGLQWVTPTAAKLNLPSQISVGLAAVASPVTTTTVQIGSERFESVPTGLHSREIFSGEAGLVGNSLLSQFKLTVDEAAGRLILEKY